MNKMQELNHYEARISHASQHMYGRVVLRPLVRGCGDPESSKERKDEKKKISYLLLNSVCKGRVGGRVGGRVECTHILIVLSTDPVTTSFSLYLFQSHVNTS